MTAHGLHPEIREHGPGTCPICGMVTLEPAMPSLEHEDNRELRDFSHRFWWTLPLTLVVFTLDEIHEVLARCRRGEDGMGSLRLVAQRKLAAVEAGLVERTRIRDGLRALVAACPIPHAPDENTLNKDTP